MNLSMLPHIKVWLLSILKDWMTKPEVQIPSNPLLVNWEVFKSTLDNISVSDLVNVDIRLHALEPVRSTHTSIKLAIAHNAELLSNIHSKPVLSRKDIVHFSHSTPLSTYMLDDKGNYLPSNQETITSFYEQCVQLRTSLTEKLLDNQGFQDEFYKLNMYLGILSNTLEDLLAANQ